MIHLSIFPIELVVGKIIACDLCIAASSSVRFNMQRAYARHMYATSQSSDESERESKQRVHVRAARSPQEEYKGIKYGAFAPTRNKRWQKWNSVFRRETFFPNRKGQNSFVKSEIF